jgi:hypothetical protein
MHIQRQTTFGLTTTVPEKAKQRKLPECTPPRETLAQVLQRGCLQDQLLDLHGHREDYFRIKVFAWCRYQPRGYKETKHNAIVIN